MPVIDNNGLKRITRLGALIRDLREDGWSIDREWKGGGSDCVYKLKSAPHIPKLVWSEEKKAMVYAPLIHTERLDLII